MAAFRCDYCGGPLDGEVEVRPFAPRDGDDVHRLHFGRHHKYVWSGARLAFVYVAHSIALNANSQLVREEGLMGVANPHLELLMMIKRMREAQKEYFRTRSVHWLEAAKRYEKEINEIIELAFRPQPTRPQPTKGLFDERAQD